MNYQALATHFPYLNYLCPHLHMQVVHQRHQHFQQQQFPLLYPWCTLHNANNSSQCYTIFLLSYNKALIATKYGQTHLWVVPLGTLPLSFLELIELWKSHRKHLNKYFYNIFPSIYFLGFINFEISIISKIFFILIFLIIA